MFESEKEKLLHDLHESFWISSKQCATLFGVSTRSWLRIAERQKITKNKEVKISRYRSSEVLAYFISQYGEI